MTTVFHLTFQCQMARWSLHNYENGFDDDMEHLTYDEVMDYCEYACGHGECTHVSSHLNNWMFENHDTCDRIGFHNKYPTLIHASL